MTRKTENFHSKIEQHLEEDESDEPQGWAQMRLVLIAKKSSSSPDKCDR